jgi:hypothetical protein
MARALQEAHQKGVNHRDIKPQNILLSKSKEAKVADFGIARAATATTMTQVGSVMGTVHYMSPEQALGEPATSRSDLYSLGVVLYEMLTGELPYDAETPAGVVMKHVGGLSRSPRETNPDVPEELDAVSARLLSRDPDDRYPDASALVEELERVKEGLPLTEETMRARMRVRRAGRLRRRGVLVALALVVVSVGVIAAVALGRGLSLVSEPSTLPSEGRLLEPGTYRTEEFKPAFTFTIDKGWFTLAPELPDTLSLGIPLRGSLKESLKEGRASDSLTFYTPRVVVEQPRAETLEPAPDSVDGWVAWLQKHPNLATEKPVPVKVGGASGVRIDTVVSSVPKGQPALFWQTSDGETITAPKGERLRTIIVDVGGDPVLIITPSSKFLPKAQEVLATVEWRG